MKEVLSATRYVILLPVVGSFVAATVLFGYAGVRTCQLTVAAVSAAASTKGSKR